MNTKSAIPKQPVLGLRYRFRFPNASEQHLLQLVDVIHVDKLGQAFPRFLHPGRLHNGARHKRSSILLVQDGLLEVQTPELSRNSVSALAFVFVHVLYVILCVMMYLRNRKALTLPHVQLTLLRFEQSDLILLLVELIDQECAWVDQTSLHCAILHPLDFGTTFQMDVELAATPLQTVKESSDACELSE